MLSLSFSPLVPDYALWVLGAALVLAVLAVASRGPIAILRALALGLVLLALANPSLVQEDREKVKDIVAVVIDRSTVADSRRPRAHDRSGASRAGAPLRLAHRYGAALHRGR